MTCFVIVTDGLVVQKQPAVSVAEADSGLFIEAPDWVVFGYLYDAATNTFSAPVIPAPEPQPYTLPVAIFWLRMTDEEAEAFDGDMATAPPLRLRRSFNTANSMHSDGELFIFVRGVLEQSVTPARAAEIMAEATGATSSAANEMPATM